MASINICERATWGGTQLVGISREDRRLHSYIIGKSGTGKSTLLRNMLVQDIEAGHGVALLDPHGDLADDLLSLIPPSRIDHVVYFNPADLDRPCAFNALKSSGKPDLVASSVVSALKNIWSESWGPRLEYILYASVAALAECESATVLGIPRLLVDPAYREWVVRQVKDPVVSGFWLNEYESYDKRFRNEAIAPVLNKVGQFLMSPAIRSILGQVKNKIDFRFIMDRERIFIANLSKGLLGEEKSALLGALLVSQFEIAAMSRASMDPKERKDFSLVVDEFQAFATESFASMLSESRKYGLNLTLCNQFTAQLKPEIRDAIFGNVGSLISFRIGHDDAQVVCKEMGETFEPRRLTSLNRFEIAARLSTGGEPSEAFFANTLPPLGRNYARANFIRSRSAERFTTPRDVVEYKITRWLRP